MSLSALKSLMLERMNGLSQYLSVPVIKETKGLQIDPSGNPSWFRKFSTDPIIRFVALGFMITLALLILVGIVSSRRGITVQDVDTLIRKELPIGSSKRQVDEFLISRKFRLSGYHVGPDPLYGLPESERQTVRYVTARVSQTDDNSQSNYDIFMVFYFDEELNLINYELQRLDDVP